MPLVDVTKTAKLDHPFEDGEWIEIRSLLASEMDDAKDVRMKHLMDLFGDAMENIARSGSDDDDEKRNSIAARAQSYDRSTLLKYAVVGWSYPEPFDTGRVERLDAATQDWLVEEVVTRNSRPPGKGKSTAVN